MGVHVTYLIETRLSMSRHEAHFNQIRTNGFCPEQVVEVGGGSGGGGYFTVIAANYESIMPTI